MAKGKRLSNGKMGVYQLVPIPLYNITVIPKTPRGAKKEIRDKDGKLEFHIRNSRISAYTGISEKEKITAVEFLKSKGYKKPTVTQMSMNFPKICPTCKHSGTVSWNKDKGHAFEKEKVKFWYNHKKTQPRTRCFAGVWDNKTKNFIPKGGIDPLFMFMSSAIKEYARFHKIQFVEKDGMKILEINE